jgi:hypothetical protein
MFQRLAKFRCGAPVANSDSECQQERWTLVSMLQREGAGLKHRWPRIVALLTCLTMTLVVAEQGGTITTQQNLIRVLWSDSKQLNSIRVQELNKQREKMFPSDPQYAAPEQKPPAAKPPVPPAKPAPRAHASNPESPNPESPKAESRKPTRVLWQI